MAKFTASAVLDAALNEIRNTATLMVVTPGQPASFAAAQATKLAEVAMTTADMTLAAGPSGRRLTVAAKAAVPVTVSGTGDHVCLLDVSGSRLLSVTTAPPQSLTASGTVDIAGWTIDINNPT